MAPSKWMIALTVGLATTLSACSGADPGIEADSSASDDGSGAQAAEVGAPEIGVLQSALQRGAGGTQLGYTCDGLMCTCTGDVDCNDMFSSGKCGDVSSCDETDPLNPVCRCLILKVSGPKPVRMLSAAASGSATLSAR